VINNPRLRQFADIVGDPGILVLSTLIILVLSSNSSDLLVMPLFWGLVLFMGLNRGRVSKLLSWRPFHFLGEISYSIYMTHWFVGLVWIYISKKLLPAYLSPAISCLVLFGLFLIILSVSAMAHHFVEGPGRKAVRALAARLGAMDGAARHLPNAEPVRMIP
jgi:peptidoglycan/LPS O-acetylase OafA/YrhL